VSAGAQLQTWTARWRRQRWVVFTVDSVEGPLVRALVHGERVALLQFGMIRPDAWKRTLLSVEGDGAEYHVELVIERTEHVVLLDEPRGISTRGARACALALFLVRPDVAAVVRLATGGA